MLEAIADFWKPSKKGSQEKLDPKQLQVGSSLGFGFVPQANLSGRRLAVAAVNTYQFGDEALTSFVLAQDKDAGASMIIAESDGEQYLAISRRISIGDRMKMFDSADLENVLSKPDGTKLPCKDAIADFKGWTVSSYRREIQGMKGHIFKGDFRGKILPAVSEGQEFEYTLLVSDSNEHAIEIEKYSDGRTEIYATVYRRMNDVGEVTHPGDIARPDIKLASTPEQKPAAPAKQEEAQQALPIKLQEFQKAPANVTMPARPEPFSKPPLPMPAREEKKPAPITETAKNGVNTMNPTNATAATIPAADANKPKLFVQPATPEAYAKKEVKAVNNGATNNFDSDAIECDLRVANKIIDAAIRDQMRLADVVRHIIELPVANQESVQIPVTLTDEDYALLAIRYGIAASDKNAIKRRIIEDLNDFSGNGAAKKAA